MKLNNSITPCQFTLVYRDSDPLSPSNLHQGPFLLFKIKYSMDVLVVPLERNLKESQEDSFLMSTETYKLNQPTTFVQLLIYKDEG